jgi:hypothetical protein
MTLKVDETRVNQANVAGASAARMPARSARAPRLPYFDVLLSLLERVDGRVEAAFGRHVHWGCWPDPGRAMGDAADYAAAAERPSLEACAASTTRALRWLSGMRLLCYSILAFEESR